MLNAEIGVGCGGSADGCGGSGGCSETPDFCIKRHDTRPAFRVSVSDCDGVLDLTDENLALEASMWFDTKIKSAINQSATVISFADNIGEMGDIKNNQNGIMAEILSLKNRLDLVARDVENLQNGFINSNNRNFGVQIFQGDGGLAVGLSLMAILALIAANYKLKADRYRKTAEIFGDQIKKMADTQLEDRVFTAALAKKVEADVYKILKK